MSPCHGHDPPVMSRRFRFCAKIRITSKNKNQEHVFVCCNCSVCLIAKRQIVVITQLSLLLNAMNESTTNLSGIAPGGVKYTLVPRNFPASVKYGNTSFFNYENNSNTLFNVHMNHTKFIAMMFHFSPKII